MCGWQLYTFHLLISGHDRRTEPKFGSHVRIDTPTLNFFLTHPTPGGGFRGLYIVKNLSRRIASKFGTHVRIDTLTLKKKLTHPTPRGFRGLYIVKNLLRRIAPKFGTHVRIDTLTLKKIKILTHPTPGGFRGLYIVKKSFATDRAQIWHACADRYSHLKKIYKKIDPPHPRGG